MRSVSECWKEIAMKMRAMRWMAVAGTALAAAAFAAGGIATSEAQDASAGTPVSMVVSVEAKHGKEIPPITIEDVKVFQGSTPDRVTEFTPLAGEKGALQLYVLVDDSAEPSIGNQFDDVRAFLNAQPASTQVAIGYLANGTVKTAQAFTADRELAGKALRLPLGSSFGGPSPYLSVSDLIKHWPAFDGRREILMLSEGADELQSGAQNSYLDAAVQDAQRAGVQVYAIYTSDSGHMGHTYWRISWGQYDLSRLTDETGGELYWQGFETPVSFDPYLKEFGERLAHQYRLTFVAHAGKKSGMERVSFETSARDAQIVGAHEVYVPVSK
jgi:hypothetical protein